MDIGALPSATEAILYNVPAFLIKATNREKKPPNKEDRQNNEQDPCSKAKHKLTTGFTCMKNDAVINVKDQNNMQLRRKLRNMPIKKVKSKYLFLQVV